MERLVKKYLSGVNTSEIGDSKNSIIIPIPLHHKKRRKRGFNQSDIIADILSQYLNLPVYKNVLKKIRDTKPQMTLRKSEERSENISNSFTLAENYPKDIEGKNIIIVDDVCTSGATIKEARKVLSRLKPRKVIGFVIAKT